MPTSWRIPKSVIFALLIAAILPAVVQARASGGLGTDPGAPPTTGTGTGGGGSSDGVFPVRGKHTYGDGLGAGRGHQGQDILAKCGKPIVAAESGRVRYVKYQSAAGNYVVVKSADHDEFYAHLKQEASVSPGDRVSAGQQIGVVGDTGDATTCHLHFEMWGKPGWYRGGALLDPKPFLKRWDKTS